MSSQAVSFELEFPARRLLQSTVQTSSVDPSSEAFKLQLRAAVAASLAPAIPESDVLVASTSDVRVLSLTIIGFASRGATHGDTVVDAASSRFIAAVETRLGVTVNVHSAPTITTRITPAPSPPPAPPTSPQSSPLEGGSFGNSLSVGAESTSGAGLSQEMVWVIIIATIIALIIIGCGAAFCLGKRSAKKAHVVQVGRPALRRQMSPEEHSNPATASSAAGTSAPQAAATNLRVEDVRLVELGMAVERSMAVHRQPSSPVPAPPAMSVSDLALKLSDVQAAVEDMRESLSPRGQGSSSPRSLERTMSMPRSPRPIVDARIRPSANMHV